MNQQLSTARYFASGHNDPDSVPEEPKKRGRWSIYLTVICVLFALISIAGALSAAYGLSGLYAETEPVKIARTSAERELQKIADAQTAAKEKYFPMLLYLEIVKLGLAAAFMFASVYLLSKTGKARTFAIAVVGMALFYNVCAIGVSILMISETGGVVNSMLDDAFSKMQFQSAEQKEKMTDYVKNSMLNWVTVILAVLFLVKLLFYGAILAYFWTDDVKKIFGENPLEYMQQEMDEADAEALASIS